MTPREERREWRRAVLHLRLWGVRRVSPALWAYRLAVLAGLIVSPSVGASPRRRARASSRETNY